MERVDYFHVELETHDVILAEGAPSESFLDDNSRRMFHNAAEFTALYPNAPAVHGGQQLRLFNAHHDEYGFQPIVVFDSDGRMIAAVLRPASRPSGKQIVRWLHRLVTAIRGHWPRVEIMLRADSHYCTPEVLRFCRARSLDYTLGVAPTSTLRKHVLGVEESTAARAAKAADGTKLRRFKEFHDAAGSWDRVERIIARVKAGPQGTDTRFIVTSLSQPFGRTVYQDIYCARGQAENHIKAWKTHVSIATPDSRPRGSRLEFSIADQTK